MGMDLYRVSFLLQNLKRVGSVESFTSFYSTVPEKGDYTISGEVLFGVEYSGGKLLIHVNKARDIAAADKSGTSDSYVKTYLLPDKKKETKKKTKVVKKTLYPVFNETLKVLCVSLSIFSYLLYYFPVIPPVRASFSRCGQEDTLVECVGLGQVWKEQLSRRSPCSSVRAGPEWENGEVVASSGHSECVCVCEEHNK